MLDRAGTQLGSYRLLRLLGHGSTAEVYLGEHVYLKRFAALKVFHDRLVNEDIEQFIREAQTLSGLNHPHIVRVLDFAVQDHQPFLVTEYAPHGNLRTRYPGGKRVPLPELTSYIRQAASALQYAHEKELVHRDIKPENMLLGPQQELLLSDFGIAVFAPPPLAPYAQEKNQALVGTLPYMAPEQLQGQPQPASDQYALAIMIYEWLCGRRPFEGTPGQIALQHLSTSPASLHEVLPDLSPALEEVVLRALAKDPQQRFASVSEFADAFLQAAHDKQLMRAQITVPMSKNGGVPSPREVLASPIVVQEQVPVEPITDPREAKEAITGDDEEQDTGEDGVEEQPLWNVPHVFTSLLGREREITDVCALLTSAGVRLVTLLGTGGIGKTRLSLQIASELRRTFVDGVCFVALTAINDPELVLPGIAHELGLQEQNLPALRRIQEFLREKRILLVLDNLEQVVKAAPSLEQILAACPGVKVLVTSRIALRIPSEQQFWLSSLAVPDLQLLQESEAIGQYASVALFVQRARTLQPDFQVTQANAAALAEICARLDGLPLAIELAAVRVKLLPPHALLPRLKNSLQVLTKGMPTQPTRQQTLRSTIQWSYDLLDPWEQQLFRLLSVFSGGFTLSAAEALSFALKEEDKESVAGVLDGVDSLIDKSLLLPPLSGEDEEPRLGMLETIREYGRERLAESGEMEAARRAHAAFYLQFAQDVSREHVGAKQARWIKRLEQDYDNLRATMSWMLEEGSEGQSVERVEMAVRLGNILEPFWRTQGYISEGWSFMEQVLAKSEGIMPGVQAQALITASILVGSLGDRNRAETLLEQGLAICRELGDTQRSAYCLRNLGWMAHVKGNFTRAQVLYEESLELFEQLNDRRGVALSSINMGFLAQSQGDYERAYRMFAEALAKFRELRDVHHITGLLFQLAQLLYVSREQPPATEIGSLLNESIALAQELGDRGGIMNARALLGCLAFIEGDLVTARLLLEEVVPFYKSSGDRRGAGEWLATLARIMTAQGDYSAASVLFDESLAIGREIGDRTEITTLCLEGVAHLATAQGLRVWAVRLWGAAEKVREETAFPMIPVERIPYQRSIEDLRAFFGEEVFSKLWAEGRTMSVEEAVSARFAPPPRPSAPVEPLVTRKKTSAYPAGLSAREVDVLRLVARGLTDIEVAERLVLSSRTVSTHLSSIYNKLGINTRAAATRFAVEHHLV